MKRLLRILLVGLVVVLLLGLAVRWYLKSKHVADKVTARLEEMIGAPVKIGNVDVSVTGDTSLGDVELFEPGAKTSGQPWLKADRIEADVSALKMATGEATPHELRLSGAALTLRFDQQGHLLTRLPGHHGSGGGRGHVNLAAFPDVSVQSSKVILQRPGGPPLVIGDASAELRREDGKLVVSGQADSPAWGKWTVQGSFDDSAGQVAVTLQSQGPVHVTQKMLSDLPFIAPSIWEAVRIPQGDTPGRVVLDYDLSARVMHYRVEMTPTHTAVEVPGISFRASDAAGKVVVQDNQVDLNGVHGQAYGGTLGMSADFQFGPKRTRLHFGKITAAGLRVADLPPSWKVPRQLKGQLSGTAALDVMLQPEMPPTLPATALGLAPAAGAGPLSAALVALPGQGRMKVTTSGSGQGQISGATIGGQPAKIGLKLLAGPEGIRFGSEEKGEVRRTPAGNADIAEAQKAGGPVDTLVLALLLSHTTAFQGPAQLEPESLTSVPAQLANAAAALMAESYRRTLSVGRSLTGLLPRDLKRRPRPPGKASSYLEINLSMKKVDLAKFVKGLRLKLPFAVEGRLTFQVKAGIPVDSPGDVRAYRVKGNATVTDLNLAGVKLNEVQAQVRYEAGVLYLDSLQGTLAAAEKTAGVLRGSARLPISPLGDLTADLSLDGISLARLAQLAGVSELIQGTASGKLHIKAPGDQLNKLTAWTGRGRLTLASAKVYGLPVQDAQADLTLEKGRLSLTNAQAKVAGTSVSGSGDINLTGSFPYTVQLATRAWNLEALQRLAPQSRPPFRLAGRLSSTLDLHGTLRPFLLLTTGKAEADELRIADFRLKAVRFHWNTRDNRLFLKDVHADLYEGTATGAAVVPLASKATGNVSLHLKDLDVGELARGLPDLPLSLKGRADGDLEGTLPPAGPDGERPVKLDLDLKAPKLRVQGIPTEQLHGTLKYRAKAFDYHLEGKSLGGTFELDGRYPPTRPAPKSEGRLRIHGVRLDRLFAALTHQAKRSPLGGTLDLDLDFAPRGPGGTPVGEGRVVLTDVRWHRSRLGTVQGTVLLSEERLSLRGLSGNLGGGIVRAGLRLDLRRPGLGRFSLDLDGVDAGALLGPWLRTAKDVRGPVDGRIRGSLGRTWQGHADLVFQRGKVFGAEVTEWRLPVRWEFSPGQGRGRAMIEDSGAQVARGRATGRATVRWGDGLTLDGQVRFFGVDLRTLLREGLGSDQLGSGRLTGRFTFAGSDVRSLSDLTGLLEVTLGQAQALQYPVLRELSPFVAVSPSTSFTRGALRARLAHGLVRVERLSLEGGSIRLFADGTITLPAGRLNLEVTTTTGRVGLDPFRLRLLGISLPATGPVPITLLVEANSLLSNLLLELRVTGTVRTPVIRVEPLATLRREALLFFLNSAGLPQP
jgi:hypothetical protein